MHITNISVIKNEKNSDQGDEEEGSECGLFLFKNLKKDKKAIRM
jgi:hypothetical protein